VLRRLAKTGVAWSVAGTGADALWEALAGSRRLPVVLGYHRVVDDFAGSAPGALPGMIISLRMLEQQLDWIGRRFDFVSPDELSTRATRRRPAVVTFDDGYADVYEHALPLLCRKGIPAAVFVVTKMIASGKLHLHDRLHMLLAGALARDGRARERLSHLLQDVVPAGAWPRPRSAAPASPFALLRALLEALPHADLRRVARALEAETPVDANTHPGLRPLTWSQVRELRRAGMTIGSHTLTHALLTQEDSSTVQAEVTGSRRDLERELGSAVEHFAYPDGRFDDVVLAAVAAAGYRFAYTTCAHRDPRHPSLTIPRRMLWETSCVGVRGRFSGAVMSCQAAGLFRQRTRCTHGRRAHHAAGPIAAIAG
jgi:peptidoglycan/xylan/chitin deacetylase (PgdA/CDA1 family)